MQHGRILLALLASASPAWAQEAAPQGLPEAREEIVVTAQGRTEPLARVPVAATVVGGGELERSGGTDIRALDQLVPSLLVSSSSTEAVGAAARIRGVGTVGDNPGLESSVAVFVDGVYRARTGAALTELGTIDRIEVLRGPQGTLFGRNASAGLIQVFTASPSFTSAGEAALTIGNYRTRRLTLGLTGPLTSSLAYRLDAVRFSRDGFVRDVNSGHRVNDRDRWLVRGQLLFRPTDDLSLRVIGDYARRDEECCAGAYLPLVDRRLGADGQVVESASSTAGLIAALGGAVPPGPFSREVAITPGRSFRADVRDGGLSAQLDWTLGAATLTAISAARDWRYVRGQDGDFGTLDLLARDDDGGAGERIRTLSQEVRVTGRLGRLEWLVGGYLADERLRLADNFQYGRDFGRFYSCLVARQIAGAIDPAARGCLAPAVRASLGSTSGAFGGAGPAAAAPILLALDRLAGIDGGGILGDRFVQHSRNIALFTHQVLQLTDRLSLTGGLRFTRERKALHASLDGSSDTGAICRTNGSQMAALRADLSLPASVRGVAASLAGFPCVLSPIVSADLRDHLTEKRFTGSAALSFRPVPGVLTYLSYARGYKAGGYNLDRGGLVASAPQAASLRFKPERVSAAEIGVKFGGPRLNLSVAGFVERFRDFQLNSFNGSSFAVETIEGCSSLAAGGGADGDNVAGNGACTGKARAGVVSRGVELEGSTTLAEDLSARFGVTWADTRYAKDLTGADGGPLGTGFFQLPGARLSNAPAVVATGSLGWTPMVGTRLRALAYVDGRYQSRIDTGSDLDLEKRQRKVFVADARIGLGSADGTWSAELWAQNLLNAEYIQVGFDAPAQPGGGFNTTRGVQRGFQATGTQLFGAFLADPRTWGVTLRRRF